MKNSVTISERKELYWRIITKIIIQDKSLCKDT